MKHFSGLTFIRYASDQNVSKPNKFKYIVSTKIESALNNTAKIQLRSFWNLSFHKISKFVNCIFVIKCITCM